MSKPVVLVGRHPVRAALLHEADHVDKVLLQRSLRGVSPFRRMARSAGVPVQDVPQAKLQHLAGSLPHQGVVAIRAALSYADLEAMLAGVAGGLDAVRATKPRILVLDGIQDPRNYGALLRTAAAAGVRGIIVGMRHMAPLNAAVIKASAGTASCVPIARVRTLPTVLYQLKERGYYVVGTANAGGIAVWEADWNRAIALVVGSEHRGLRQNVAKECDYCVTIPMAQPVESLNVSVAAGIILFAASKP